jgi:HPr kinase/phosphorylase
VTSAPRASIHAAAVIVAEAGVLIRGASGAGKSSLALAVVEAARLKGLFACLVADDRVFVEPCNSRLIARPHPAIAGQVERRGQGIGPAPHEAAAILRCVVDFAPAAGSPGAPDRMPGEGEDFVTLENVRLPRLTVPTGLGAAETARIFIDFLARRPL